MSPATDTLSMTFAALSDPTRRAMLARLVQGEASVNELAVPFSMSLPAISKHIKVLEKAGLLVKTRQAQQRPCRIDGAQLRQAVDWIDQYRQLWEKRLDRLDDTLLELHAREAAANPDTSKPVGTPDKTRRTPRTARTPTKEKTDEAPLQQQIGFDF